MFDPIIRVYESRRDADAAAAALREAGWQELAVFGGAADPLDPQDLGRAMREAGIAANHAAILAGRVAAGGAVVAVEPRFGSTAKAERILDAHRPVESGLPEPSYMRPEQQGFMGATPFSNWLQWPTLSAEKLPFEAWTGWRSLSRKPFYAERWWGGGLLSRKRTPLSIWLGLRVLLQQPTPLSSRFGWSLLSREPAPFSKRFNLQVLSGEKQPLSGRFGWRLLSRRATPFSDQLGWRVLAEDPTPFSSALGWPVLASERKK